LQLRAKLIVQQPLFLRRRARRIPQGVFQLAGTLLFLHPSQCRPVHLLQMRQHRLAELLHHRLAEFFEPIAGAPHIIRGHQDEILQVASVQLIAGSALFRTSQFLEALFEPCFRRRYFLRSIVLPGASFTVPAA
jgi:hypothetical protein